MIQWIILTRGQPAEKVFNILDFGSRILDCRFLFFLQMPESRRHIAVMFTDIVGYTALMGSDEDKAFDMLKRNHTIHETLINKHNGTLIKEIGDGTLASFHLASDAVRCAMDIQSEAKTQNIVIKQPYRENYQTPHQQSLELMFLKILLIF